MKVCRNGHDLTREGARIWTGDHWQCRTCRRASQRNSQARYLKTAKGFLTSIRANANRRGNS